MKVTVTPENKTVTLVIDGRIDTLTAPELEQAVQENASQYDSMIMDMSGVDYISSAGLRVMVYAHQVMAKKNGLILKGVNRNVMEIFRLTGFSRVIRIEE